MELTDCPENERAGTGGGNRVGCFAVRLEVDDGTERNVGDAGALELSL